MKIGQVEILSGPDELQHYGRDWTRVHSPAPCAVARPHNAEQVAEVLRYCYEHDIAVVPSGGRTGLSAGAVAANGELVLSLERLDSIGAVDSHGLTLRVGAGAITQKVHQAAAQHGLTWPIDLASKGSCQIGGNLATNAGGLRVIRYGHTRQWVLGLSAVLMDGTCLQLDAGLHKDNCGPDLRQLLIGSEGILGVITSATLKLTPLPRHSQVVLLAIQDLKAALEVVRQARVEVQLPLLAVEFLSQNCLKAVMKVQGFACPVSQMPSALLLLEVEEDQRLSGLLESWLSDGLVSDGVVSANSQERARLWAYRERITESLGSLGLMHKNDVSLEVARLPEFFEQLAQREIGYPGEVFLFGHLGDGNVHVNVMKPAALPAEEFWPACKAGDHKLYQLLSELGGSISAEHGIGLLKRDYLHYCRTSETLQTLAVIKSALDPKGLLNPGKVISSPVQKLRG